jgi:NitT/TauT family transport system substrate-binding protein
MALRIEKGGWILIFLIGLGLVGYSLYRYGVWDLIAPEKRGEGKVSKEDFAQAAPGPTTAPGPAPAGAAAPAASAGAGSRLNRPIRVAIVLWGGYAGGILANGGLAPSKDSAFYKDFGIQVEMFQIDDFVKSCDAFRAGGDRGGVDIMWSTVDAYALEYGGLAALKPKAIMQYDWSRGGDAIAVDGSIKTVTDLKGKKLAVAQETPSHYFALFVLTQGGLSNLDVNWVFTDSAVDAANVFKAGKVDAAVSWSPDVYVAARERPGGRILASTREATNLIADIFVARGDFLEKHPEDARRFVAGWLKGVEMVRDNPTKTTVLLQKSLTGVNSLEDAKAMLEDVKLPDYGENRAFFDPQGSLVTYNTIFQTAQGMWRKIGKIRDVVQPQQTVDTRFLEGAAEFFRQAAPAKPEFEFKTPPQPAGAPILTKRISIYFPTGSATVDENARAILDLQVVELAATFGNAYLRIAGNTDNVGGRETNMRLSQQRAEAVASYLMAKGFDRNKFEVVGSGPDRPVARNDTEEGRAKNRRTDFEVIPR